ncbi:MAG TPA: CHRD domain-containing protein [Candidatus Saccharimonadales bacterium]|nr:CHRD domain-containing protein [Candidatus Saccharimonadales bacterium]
MRKWSQLLAVLALLAAVPAAHASTLFIANLDGAQEPSASTATGYGTVVLNDAMTMITVDESWTGLIGGPATASHIHGAAPPGANAPVLFPFAGVPAATSGSIPEQTFAITPTQVGWLQSGLLYFNIHDAQFPGGEIRGQIYAAVPDAGTLPLVAAGLVALAAVGTVSRRSRA